MLQQIKIFKMFHIKKKKLLKMVASIIIIWSAFLLVPFDPQSTMRSAGATGLDSSLSEPTEVQESEGPCPGHPAHRGELGQGPVLLNPRPGLCDGTCDF